MPPDIAVMRVTLGWETHDYRGKASDGFDPGPSSRRTLWVSLARRHVE